MWVLRPLRTQVTQQDRPHHSTAHHSNRMAPDGTSPRVAVMVVGEEEENLEEVNPEGKGKVRPVPFALI